MPHQLLFLLFSSLHLRYVARRTGTEHRTRYRTSAVRYRNSPF
jgi:hypothetical protein